MEPGHFRKLILKIFNGTINEKEYKELSNYMIGIIRKVSNNLAQKHGGPGNRTVIELLMNHLGCNDKEACNYIYEEFIIKILNKKQILSDSGLSNNKFKNYVVSMIYNLIIDLRREFTRKIKIKQEEGEKIINSLKKEIYDIARIEFKQSLIETFGEDDLKYICYLLSSKKYKCLWAEKKENAIYQDVRRNKERVLKVLGGLIRDLNLDEEVYEDVIKPVLSEICEELRNKKCKGGDT